MISGAPLSDYDKVLMEFIGEKGRLTEEKTIMMNAYVRENRIREEYLKDMKNLRLKLRRKIRENGYTSAEAV